jgi:hypothetical protein
MPGQAPTRSARQRRAVMPRLPSLLLLALLAALTWGTAAHAAPSLPSLSAAAGGAPQAQTGQLHVLVGASAQQPAAAVEGTIGAAQSAGSIASGSAAAASQSAGHALAPASSGTERALSAASDATAPAREGARSAAATVIAQAHNLASHTLAHASRAVRGVSAPAPGLAGAATRLLLPTPSKAGASPLAHSHESRRVAGLSGARGGRPPMAGQALGLLGSAPASPSPLATPTGPDAAGGVLGCALAGVDGAFAARCGAALSLPSATPASSPLGLGGAEMPPRPPPGFAPAGGINLAAPSARPLAHSPLESLLGGLSGASASAAGMSLATALMLAALLLLGPPRLTRTLPRRAARAPVAPFTLVPERPG